MSLVFFADRVPRIVNSKIKSIVLRHSSDDCDDIKRRGSFYYLEIVGLDIYNKRCVYYFSESEITVNGSNRVCIEYDDLRLVSGVLVCRTEADSKLSFVIHVEGEDDVVINSSWVNDGSDHFGVRDIIRS